MGVWVGLAGLLGLLALTLVSASRRLARRSRSPAREDLLLVMSSRLLNEGVVFTAPPYGGGIASHVVDNVGP